MNIEAPTADQCSQGAELILPNGSKGKALWYPQMGGYVSKCIVVASGTCFDVYIWHDGEFPFEGDSPVRLHHCSAEQFVSFGRSVSAFLGTPEGK
jgi:hypothetical protein